MSTPSKSTRPPRPTYTEGFKNGAVELYHTRRRESPLETHYAATMAVGKTMGVSNMTINNWVTKAQAAKDPAPAVESAKAGTLPSSDSALTALIDVLSAPDRADDAAPAEEAAVEGSGDPQVIILELRRQLAEARRANLILKSATAYLASEALKVA